MPPFVPEPGERARASGPPPSPTPPGRRAPTAGGIFYKYNTGGKKSITVDARHPEGLAVLKELVARLRRRDRELRGGHPRPLGARSYEVMRGDPARHHLRVDVRFRPRGARHQLT